MEFLNLVPTQLRYLPTTTEYLSTTISTYHNKGTQRNSSKRLVRSAWFGTFLAHQVPKAELVVSQRLASLPG